MEAKESEMKSLNETNLELRKLLDRQQNYGRWKLILMINIFTHSLWNWLSFDHRLNDDRKIIISSTVTNWWSWLIVPWWNLVRSPRHRTVRFQTSHFPSPRCSHCRPLLRCESLTLPVQVSCSKTQSWLPCSSVPARFIASVLASCWCFVWRRGRPLCQITHF